MASESEPKFHGQVEEDFSYDEEFICDWVVIEEDEFHKTDDAVPNDDDLKTEVETADSAATANMQNPESETEVETDDSAAAANMQNPESETENGQEVETADSADSNVQNPESEIEVNDSGSAMANAGQARVHTDYHQYSFNFSFLDFVVTVFMTLEDTNSSSRFDIHIEGNYHSNDSDDEVEEDEDEEEEDYVRVLYIDLVEKLGVIFAYLIECIAVLYLMWMAYSSLMPNTSSEDKRLNMI